MKSKSATAHRAKKQSEEGEAESRVGALLAGSGGVQSLQRGLAILERVSQSVDGVTLARLAELTGMKKTTVHNLARTLLNGGYLARWTQPVRYAPGPALAALAGRGTAGNALHVAAEPLLLTLVAEFPGSAAQLSEASGTDIRTMLRVAPEAPARVERPVDRFNPPYISATSLVYLSLGGDAWRESCMQRYPFPDYGAPLWGTMGVLEAQLEKARAERGIALEKPGSSMTPMAVPVTGARGELLATLGLAFRISGSGGGGGEGKLVQVKRVALSRLRELAGVLGTRFGGGA